MNLKILGVVLVCTLVFAASAFAGGGGNGDKTLPGHRICAGGGVGVPFEQPQ